MNIDPALKAKIKARELPEDQLIKVRNAIRKMRDLQLEISSIEEHLQQKKTELNDLASKEVLEVFDEVGVRTLGLEAEGNLPAYDAKIRPIYAAGIPASWPNEKQEAAYRWLHENGHGDLIKTQFTIKFGLTNQKEALQFEELLCEKKVDFDRKQSVPHTTLTAFIKDQIENQGLTPPLDVLGATVLRKVDLKPAKEKKIKL